MHKKLISENISDADAESLFNDNDFDKNYASDDVSPSLSPNGLFITIVSKTKKGKPKLKTGKLKTKTIKVSDAIKVTAYLNNYESLFTGTTGCGFF